MRGTSRELASDVGSRGQAGSIGPKFQKIKDPKKVTKILFFIREKINFAVPKKEGWGQGAVVAYIILSIRNH